MWAWADFSGYIAAVELYDGPFCVLSIVDNRTFNRLLYQVLDRDPDHSDITSFLRRFQPVLVEHVVHFRNNCGVSRDALCKPGSDQPTQAEDNISRLASSRFRNACRAARSNFQSNGRGSRLLSSSYNSNRCSTSSKLAKSFGVRTFL
jgi:hypothetical protein